MDKIENLFFWIQYLLTIILFILAIAEGMSFWTNTFTTTYAFFMFLSMTYGLINKKYY